LASRDFQRVFSNPHRAADAYFTVLAVSNGGGPARLGMAVSKRQVKRAVDRSRLKRLARESFRVRRHSLTGLDLVVMARSAASSADNTRLAGSLAQLMDRLIERLERNAPASDPG
jgi:ribonuclease P protein component